MSKRIHFNDHLGPICGSRPLLGCDWAKTSSEQFRKVTCKRCVKKLREIGFAMQHFSNAVIGAIKP